ncbi:MAG: methyltetrahydrofolate cobalamin methyltransferase [Deltaproteobacteria bacterium]|nr:MAG: methyltetrahydrofolate cobalamin methyltransferase [Deltaproteobacteria bacterium]
MLIIGESINGTIPKVGQAIESRDEALLGELARTQYECGAEMLDVNAGIAGGNEIEDLPWLIDLVQKEVPLPLMIDSANPEALKAALSVYRHQESPILNSISGEEEKWNKLFPVAVSSRSRIVVLCMDDQGIPKTTEGRMDVASRLFDPLTQAGISPGHIYFDPLVLAVSVESEAALVTLSTIRALRSRFPDSHVICGASNVSMGLPGRRLINRTFIAMALLAGLDTLFIDVRDQALLSSIYAGKMLLNQDPYCVEYLKAYRAKKILV